MKAASLATRLGRITIRPGVRAMMLRILLAIASLAPATAFANDVWLVPETYRASSGQAVRLRVATDIPFPDGGDAAGKEIDRLVMVDGADVVPVSSPRGAGRSPEVVVTPRNPGHAILVAATKLRETGWETAKTILCVGDTSDDSAYAKPSGLPLDIVTESSPCRLRKDDGLTIRVLLEGKPLAGAQVAVGRDRADAASPPASTVTDRNGRATLRFAEEGMWLVRVRHPIPPADGAAQRMLVATLTLGVDSRGMSAGAVPEDVESDIRRLLDDQDAAWNRADLATAMSYYWRSGGMTYAGPDGVTRGWQALLERYQRIYPDAKAKGKVTYSDLELRSLAPDVVLVLSRWRLDRDAGPPLSGVFTFVVRRFAEGWRVIHDHSSTDD